MHDLPVLPPSCALDEAGGRAQLARYRTVGQDAEVVERTGRRIVIRVAARVPDTLVEELISTERSCCPFFELDWTAARRTLTIGVSEPAHEPALGAIAFALEGDPPV